MPLSSQGDHDLVLRARIEIDREALQRDLRGLSGGALGAGGGAAAVGGQAGGAGAGGLVAGGLTAGTAAGMLSARAIQRSSRSSTAALTAALGNSAASLGAARDLGQELGMQQERAARARGEAGGPRVGGTRRVENVAGGGSALAAGMTGAHIRDTASSTQRAELSAAHQRAKQAQAGLSQGRMGGAIDPRRASGSTILPGALAAGAGAAGAGIKRAGGRAAAAAGRGITAGRAALAANPALGVGAVAAGAAVPFVRDLNRQQQVAQARSSDELLRSLARRGPLSSPTIGGRVGGFFRNLPGVETIRETIGLQTPDSMVRQRQLSRERVSEGEQRLAGLAERDQAMVFGAQRSRMQIREQFRQRRVQLSQELEETRENQRLLDEQIGGLVGTHRREAEQQQEILRQRRTRLEEQLGTGQFSGPGLLRERRNAMLREVGPDLAGVGSVMGTQARLDLVSPRTPDAPAGTSPGGAPAAQGGRASMDEMNNLLRQIAQNTSLG